MEKYSIKGHEISEKDFTFNKYDITIINNIHVYIYTRMKQIDIIHWLTKNKSIKFFDELGFETIIHREHIVKITEVK